MSSVKHTTIKTVLYRLISWGSTTVLAWVLIGVQLSEAGTIDAELLAKHTLIFSVVDMVANTAIYFFYERFWVRFNK